MWNDLGIVVLHFFYKNINLFIFVQGSNEKYSCPYNLHNSIFEKAGDLLPKSDKLKMLLKNIFSSPNPRIFLQTVCSYKL